MSRSSVWFRDVATSIGMRRKALLGCTVLAGLLSAAAVPCFAQDATDAPSEGVGIIAIVNDQVISGTDLQDRIHLIQATSGLPNDPEVMRKIQTQVLRQLIDEKLELQEAKKQDVAVDPDEVKAELASLEQENNLPPGGLDKFLAQKGINKDTLSSQIMANIAWGQVVRRRWLPFTSVGDDEVNERIDVLKANLKSPENHIAEIFLPVNTPSEDPEVQDTAQRLIDQIRHGAHFQSVARQFSQAPSAAVGGDMGWVQVGTQSPEAEKVINQMKPGQMGGPFRLTGGYYIFALVDRRRGGSDDDLQVNLNQIVFPLAADASASLREQTVLRAKTATENARSCTEFLKIGKQVSPQLSGPLGAVRIGDLPPELRQPLQRAHVAVPTDPLTTHDGIGVYMVCSKEGGEVDKANVRSALLRQRLNNRATQYLSDLRRTAYIDMRTQS